MRKALAIGLVSTFLVASVALAATGAPKPRTQSLGGAVKRTEAASSFRYAIVITVVRGKYPANVLQVHGVSARGELFVRVKQADVVLADGTQVPGPEAAALIDGPFLYEHAPTGTVVGPVTWLRVAIAKVGRTAAVLNAIRTMTPAPLFRVLAESDAKATSRLASSFSGAARYDDPIVRTAITRLSGGLEFRRLRVGAQIGVDGLVHGIHVTGSTADRSTTLTISARMFAFGQPVHLTPPAEGTFMDQQLVTLAE